MVQKKVKKVLKKKKGSILMSYVHLRNSVFPIPNRNLIAVAPVNMARFEKYAQASHSM